MFLDQIVTNANLFFLILVRVFAMIAVAPLFSSESVPDIVRANPVDSLDWADYVDTLPQADPS